jgi:aldehyde dehydrogenase (NAD+)
MTRCKAGFPDIFFLFNDAGTELAQAFVDDKRIPLISFTGSTKVGRIVGERVAQRMGRSLLELGGNNAIIVDETADLKLAIPGHRVRRGRHRRPALHHHAPPVRA